MEEEKVKDKEKTEVKETIRSFLGPDDTTTYHIVAPDAGNIREADWNYSKTYTKCLLEGITTAAEMMEILQRRGIIGPEFEQRAMELTAVLNERIIALGEAANMEEKRNLAIAVANAREDLFQWNQRLNGPMANTCEQIADDARLEHLTSCMVTNEDGSRVWSSYDLFLEEKSQALALKSRFEVMLFLQGLTSDFLEQTPEAVTMREVEEELTDRAEEALKVAKALAEERLATAAEAAEEKTAKTTKVTKTTSRKKTTKSSTVKD